MISRCSAIVCPGSGRVMPHRGARAIVVLQASIGSGTNITTRPSMTRAAGSVRDRESRAGGIGEPVVTLFRREAGQVAADTAERAAGPGQDRTIGLARDELIVNAEQDGPLPARRDRDPSRGEAG